MRLLCFLLVSAFCYGQSQAEKEVLNRMAALEAELSRATQERDRISAALNKAEGKATEKAEKQPATAVQLDKALTTTVAATAATAAVAAEATRDAQVTNDRGLSAILIVQVSSFLLSVIAMLFAAWTKRSEHAWAMEAERAKEEASSRHRSEMRQEISKVAEKATAIANNLAARDSIAQAAEVELERIRLARLKVNAQ